MLKSNVSHSVFLASAVAAVLMIDSPGTSTAAGGADFTVSVAGDLRTHDPSMIKHAVPGGDWYVFSTGDPAVNSGTVQIRRSNNLKTWSFAGTVFTQIPQWIRDAVPGVVNLWAPEITERNGIYYLYYSASTFGSNRSVIALATNTTLDPNKPTYQWVDRGQVWASAPTDDYNAIDPFVITDTSGVPWMAMGSFWSGIRMVKLEWPSGKPPAGTAQVPLRLGDRFVPPNAIEAPAILRRGGYYYLFVSLDFCCQGTNSTYKIAVGRSTSVTGPYYDRLGSPLAHGGGTVILSERGAMMGPGGQSVVGDSYLVHHYYDRNANGDFRLAIRSISWVDGWPVIGVAD